MTSSNSKQQIDMARITAILALGVCTLSTVTARAHIDMLGDLLSRNGDQKNFPCDGKRGDGPIYTFAPGTTITLSVSEYIPHPSYFRIAFDNMGDDNFVEPKSIKPIDPLRACPYDANDKCGQADYCNVTSTTGGATVLWDNIEPHMAGAMKSYTWTVKLPDVECDNCTIQVLQIMEDTVHGAYCPSDSCTDGSLEDIYHRCIDITLKKGATNSAGATTKPVAVKGMECVKADGMPAAGSGGAMAMGGAGGSTLPAAGTTSVAGASGSAGAGGMAFAGMGAGGTGAIAGRAATAGTGVAGTAGALGSAGVSAAPAAQSGGTSAGLPVTPVAGVGAPTTPARGAVTPAAGTTGTVISPVTGAGTLATAPAAPPSTKSSGCSIAQMQGQTTTAAYAWALSSLAFVLRRKRGRFAARTRA